MFGTEDDLNIEKIDSLNIERPKEPEKITTEQADHPLTQMPEFEDHLQQEITNGNISKDEVFNVISNQQEKADIAEKAPENPPILQNEIGQTSEITSETIVNRRQISSGERSTLYILTKADGKINTQIESSYFSDAAKFIKAHDVIKNDLDLKRAAYGLSTDLAMIDATRGEFFEDGDETQRTALLENYSTLKSRLDNPDTNQKERESISEYFGQMNGEALNFLENHYAPEQAKPETAKEIEAKEEFNDNVEEVKENLENAKELSPENSDAFDDTLTQIDELEENHDADIDSLQTQLDNLSEITEKLSAEQPLIQNTDQETPGDRMNQTSEYISAAKESLENLQEL